MNEGDPRNIEGYATSRDPVNHPPHYTYGGVECIDVIWEMGHGPSFCLGNSIKYLWRAGHKGSALEDVKKSQFYLNYFISKMGALSEAQQAQVMKLQQQIQGILLEVKNA
jgi:hypothetical protein